MKPISKGKQDFKRVVTENIYIDKTQYLYRLIVEDSEQSVFASRPSRFGKSLTVSALKYLFSGDKEAFKGTYIYDTDYDFKKYKVIHLDFFDCDAVTVEELDRWLNTAVKNNARKFSMEIPSSCVKPSEAFSYLLNEIGEIEDVVVLIDEYDKAITSNLYNPEAEEIRNRLCGFFQCLKRNLRFLFITGVSKFSKLSLFSSLNNVTDISYNEDYASMFGYTQKELEENFAEYIDQGIQRTEKTREEYLGRLKEQYDGYKFNVFGESVYNPVSVGTFFYEGGYVFNNYWIETGSSSFIFNIARKTDFSVLGDLPLLSSLDFSSYDILALAKETVSKDDLVKLLFQTGYLTIKGHDELDVILDFPNLEVASSFTLSLIKAYDIGKEIDLTSLSRRTRECLLKGETGKAVNNFKTFFASFPYDVIPKDEKLYEVFYETNLYSFLRGIGECAALEEKTNLGRIDAHSQKRNLHLRAQA